MYKKNNKMKCKKFIYPALTLAISLSTSFVLAETKTETTKSQLTKATVWNESELAAIQRLAFSNLGESPELKVNKVASNPKAAELGHHLFFDTRLSSNGKISCASCHHPDKYFTDGL